MFKWNREPRRGQGGKKKEKRKTMKKEGNKGKRRIKGCVGEFKIGRIKIYHE